MAEPLRGQVIVTTRAKRQSESMTALLTALGAEVIEAPAVAVKPVADLSRVDQALRNLNDYDWLVLTSVNGVEALADRMRELGLDLAPLRGLKLAAIGPATADSLRLLGLEPLVVPEKFVAESLADALGQRFREGERFLMLRSDIARAALRDALRGMGAVCDDIPIYQTALPDPLPDDVLHQLRGGGLHWITFTSSSTFRNLRKLLGADADRVLRSVKLASIGPITSQTLREAGFEPAVEAREYTVEGLVRAICECAARGNG